MLTGAHVILSSHDADADRAFLRDVLGFPSVDAGHGWLIFQAPPAELAVHPTDGSPSHELFLMCDDLAETAAELRAKGAAVDEPFSEERWGLRTSIALPGGGQVGLYQPYHPTALDLGRATNG